MMSYCEMTRRRIRDGIETGQPPRWVFIIYDGRVSCDTLRQGKLDARCSKLSESA